MASVVSALDTHTPLQRGENLHVEHGWSNDIEEKILQLTFQLTRTKSPETLKDLGKKYNELLVFCSEDAEKLNILYRIMLHTRDIVDGKGEYALFYELLSEWVRLSYFNSISNSEMMKALTRKAILSLVKLENHDHGYGSWKDMKYFLKKLKEKFPKKYMLTDAFQYIIHIMKIQLQIDNESKGRPSLLGRWAPRESSKSFGWIAKFLAEAIFSDWMKTATTPKARQAASIKCKTHYRALLSSLNEKLRTPQVHMCDGTWSEIDFKSDVTSITLSRSKLAFEYVDKKGKVRGENEDRVGCQNKFREYISDCKSGKVEIKAARVGLIDMVKDAIDLMHKSNDPAFKTQKDTLNEQWEKNGKNIGDVGNMICMVDTSGSMECDNKVPLHAAIGLGIRVAEKSRLGPRVLTFSKTPRWLVLNQKTFTEKVAYLKADTTWGMNTNFHAALKLIADACVDKQLHPDEVADLVLAIFSDMEIDLADNSHRTMHEQIVKMFHDAGMKTKHKKPYTVPHILYWNLRSTNGFPSVSSEKNTSMMSGFSQSLLSSFQEKGLEALTDFTPWKMLINQLDNNRYQWAKDAVKAAMTLKEGQLMNVSDLPNIHEPPEIIETMEVPTTSVPKSETTTEQSSGWFNLW